MALNMKNMKVNKTLWIPVLKLLNNIHLSKIASSYCNHAQNILE
jgi:hypothetical protein